MKNLIVIEENEKYQFDDIKGLIERFINKDFFNMSEEEKQKELEKKAVANTLGQNIKIVNTKDKTNALEKDVFIIYNEITYILSMLRFERIILLERTDANIFGRYINKDNMEDNYIIVNKFTDQIMQKYLESK